MLKLGQNMELGPGIAHIMGALVLGRASFYIECTPGARKVKTVLKMGDGHTVGPKI